MTNHTLVCPQVTDSFDSVSPNICLILKYYSQSQEINIYNAVCLYQMILEMRLEDFLFDWGIFLQSWNEQTWTVLPFL